VGQFLVVISNQFKINITLDILAISEVDESQHFAIRFSNVLLLKLLL